MHACMHTRIHQLGGGHGQAGPVDGEQHAVRAGGAQLPGTVGHVPLAVSQEDQWGGGHLAGEGALVCRGGHRGLHFICTPTHISLPHFVNGVCSLLTYSASLYPTDHPIHPCSRPLPVHCWWSSTGATGPIEPLWALNETGSC